MSYTETFESFNQVHLHEKQMLYHAAIKASLHCEEIQVCF